MRLATTTLMATVKIVGKDEGNFAFVGARVRFAGTRAPQPLDCARTARLLDQNAVGSSEQTQPCRPLQKRKCSDLVELWVMLAQLAALVVLMSLFVALLSVGD